LNVPLSSVKGSLIKSYFQIVRKSVQDLVPKTIMHLLVHQVRDGLLNNLVTSLYRESFFDELLEEDENLASERNKCKAMLELYRRAAGIVATAY
jgi:dynamin 1-like protein